MTNNAHIPGDRSGLMQGVEMHLKRLIVAVTAGALLLAACGDSNNDKTGKGGESSGSRSLTVAVDADTGDTGGLAFTAFFPSKLTAHPGDTIDFEEHFTGEPHTVTFGTLIDQGMAKASPDDEDEPAELKKVPHLLPDGPGDAIQAAAQPCFLAAGTDPPASDACSKEQQKQTAFDGTQTYFNSGFLAEGEHFKVKLADSIKPGTYTYFCTLHRGGMAGKVTVVASSATADSSDDVDQAGEKERDALVAKMKDTLAGIKTGVLPPFVTSSGAGQGLVGGFSQDVTAAVPVVFAPDQISIKAGESVTWTIAGPHSVTFGGTEKDRTIIARAPDGSVHLSQTAASPAGGQGQPQEPPSDSPPDDNAPPPPPKVIDGGTYDGTGFHSSGLVLSFPPQLFAYRVKFTKPGTYTYFCVVHPDMKASVNVT